MLDKVNKLQPVQEKVLRFCFSLTFSYFPYLWQVLFHKFLLFLSSNKQVFNTDGLLPGSALLSFLTVPLSSLLRLSLPISVHTLLFFRESSLIFRIGPRKEKGRGEVGRGVIGKDNASILLNEQAPSCVVLFSST